jgi:hypothetical protein
VKSKVGEAILFAAALVALFLYSGLDYAGGWVFFRFLIVIGVSVVILWALIRASACLVKGDKKMTLRYLAVLVLGVGCFFAGRVITDYIAVRVVGPILQSAIQEIRAGKILPRISQSFPLSVSRTSPTIAVYSLGSVFSFLSSYVAYDAVDSTSQAAASRVALFLDGGACQVSARRIGLGYYFVTEACS